MYDIIVITEQDTINIFDH